MFGKTIRLSEFRVTGSICEDLIFLCFYLQMLNEKILKLNETCLKCEYQLKYITVAWEKNGTDEFREKWVWSFETLNSAYHAKYWYYIFLL